ncbi:hypothetical protein OKW46_002224 [Paraburkholderia sp. WSM4179]|nr:hypothetical protein [Paraburkholderia sp. WSM4179]
MTLERATGYLFSRQRNACRARTSVDGARETSSRSGSMRFHPMSRMIASVVACLMSCGCASAPEPRDYASNNMQAVPLTECPDVSGLYEGRVRQIVEGYGPSVLPFTDEVFHAENIEAAQTMRASYRRDTDGRRVAPDTTSFRKNADGNYTVTTYYGTSELGSIKTRFNSQVKVSCEAGTISWIAPEQSSRSEFGPNYSFSGRSVRLESNGDILLTTWTHMSYHMALLWLPMGAGTDRTVYRYKRLRSANDH